MIGPVRKTKFRASGRVQNYTSFFSLEKCALDTEAGIHAVCRACYMINVQYIFFKLLFMIRDCAVIWQLSTNQLYPCCTVNPPWIVKRFTTTQGITCLCWETCLRCVVVHYLKICLNPHNRKKSTVFPVFIFHPPLCYLYVLSFCWCSGLSAAFLRLQVACCQQFLLLQAVLSTNTPLFCTRTHWKNTPGCIIQYIMENTPFYRPPWIICGLQEGDGGHIRCELVTQWVNVWAEWEAKYWIL